MTVQQIRSRSASVGRTAFVGSPSLVNVVAIVRATRSYRLVAPDPRFRRSTKVNEQVRLPPADGVVGRRSSGDLSQPPVEEQHRFVRDGMHHERIRHKANDPDFRLHASLTGSILRSLKRVRRSGCARAAEGPSGSGHACTPTCRRCGHRRVSNGRPELHCPRTIDFTSTWVRFTPHYGRCSIWRTSSLPIPFRRRSGDTTNRYRLLASRQRSEQDSDDLPSLNARKRTAPGLSVTRRTSRLHPSCLCWPRTRPERRIDSASSGVARRNFTYEHPDTAKKAIPKCSTEGAEPYRAIPTAALFVCARYFHTLAAGSTNAGGVDRAR